MTHLYHYCSSKTFFDIISKKEIWLSSLSLSNDSMEGKLVSRTFERIIKRENIDHDVVRTIQLSIQRAEELFDGLGFCLSADGDLLSQWRSYANNGQGFSIGFSKEHLESLSNSQADNEPKLRLHDVLYEPSEHEEALRPIFEEIKTSLNDGKLNKPTFGILGKFLDENEKKTRQEEYDKQVKELWLKAINMLPNLYILKNKAFSEERESRLISHLNRGKDDDSLYRASENKLIPYRIVRLKELGALAISKVFIGPKNITPKPVVEKFLKQEGFDQVTVEISSATYR